MFSSPYVYEKITAHSFHAQKSINESRFQREFNPVYSVRLVMAFALSAHAILGETGAHGVLQGLYNASLFHVMHSMHRERGN